MKSYEGKLLINGAWVDSVSRKIEEIKSPFDGVVVGQAAVASVADVEIALQAAVSGAEIWRRDRKSVV